MTTVSSAILDPLMASDPAGPRITYYDDATGERIELSTATLVNWAAKTGNLLRDEMGAGPSSSVAVLLPAHWQTAAVLFGIWWIGAEVVTGGEADVALCTVEPTGGGRRRRRHGRGRGAVAGPVRQAGARSSCGPDGLRHRGARARRPDRPRAQSRCRAGWPVGRRRARRCAGIGCRTRVVRRTTASCRAGHGTPPTR